MPGDTGHAAGAGNHLQPGQLKVEYVQVLLEEADGVGGRDGGHAPFDQEPERDLGPVDFLLAQNPR